MAATDTSASDNQITDQASFQTLLNAFIDNTWDNLRTDAESKALLDPLPMNLDITDGGIRMWGGDISGFSRLRRKGEISLRLDSDVLKMEYDVDVGDLTAWSNAKKTTLGVGLGKSTDVAIDYAMAGLVLEINTSEGPVVISRCTVKKVDNVKVTQTHGFLVQGASIKIAQEVLDKHLQEIVEAIRQAMMKALNQVLAKIGRPKELETLLHYVLTHQVA